MQSDDLGLVEHAGFDATEIDMIRHGDMIGAALGSKILAAIAERDEARKALAAIAGVVEQSVRANGDEAFTLHLKGTTYTGPAVEFLGYALSSLGKLARQALGDTL